MGRFLLFSSICAFALITDAKGCCQNMVAFGIQSYRTTHFSDLIGIDIKSTFDSKNIGPIEKEINVPKWIFPNIVGCHFSHDISSSDIVRMRNIDLHFPLRERRNEGLGKRGNTYFQRSLCYSPFRGDIFLIRKYEATSTFHPKRRTISRIFDDNRETWKIVSNPTNRNRNGVWVGPNLLLADFSRNDICAHGSRVRLGRTTKGLPCLSQRNPNHSHRANTDKKSSNGRPSTRPLSAGIIPSVTGGMWRIPAGLLGGGLITGMCAAWAATRRRLRWRNLAGCMGLGLALSCAWLYALLG